MDPFIRMVVIDVLCLVIVWLPVLLINLLAVPFERGFYCDDTSIRYPYKDNTITDVVLFCYCIGLPVISIILVEVVRWRKWTGTTRQLIRQDSGSTIQVSSALHVPPAVAEILSFIGIFLFGGACSQLTTDIGKFSTGSLRPSFIAVCQPENLTELCPDNGPLNYIVNYKCTGTDERQLKDSRLSFPSGHSSFSTYTMLFLVFYLHRRMNWSGSKLMRSTVQLGAILLAWYTGLTRISDNKHHWGDVAAGYVIGALAASLTALHVSNMFKKKMSANRLHPALPRTEIELQTVNNNF